jgi:hypothetical protein
MTARVMRIQLYLNKSIPADDHETCTHDSIEVYESASIVWFAWVNRVQAPAGSHAGRLVTSMSCAIPPSVCLTPCNCCMHFQHAIQPLGNTELLGCKEHPKDILYMSLSTKTRLRLTSRRAVFSPFRKALHSTFKLLTRERHSGYRIKSI